MAHQVYYMKTEKPSFTSFPILMPLIDFSSNHIDLYIEYNEYLKDYVE